VLGTVEVVVKVLVVEMYREINMLEAFLVSTVIVMYSSFTQKLNQQYSGIEHEQREQGEES
jgi:hypothetical protein